MTPGKTRQKAYRQRMQEAGCKQVTLWLSSDASTALQLLVKDRQADASTVTSDAILHYHAVTSNKRAVTSDVTSDAVPVTSDVTGDNIPVTSDRIPVTGDKPAVTGNRYMSQALEDHILNLREKGLSLNAIARQLADEGYKNAKGAPYSTATLTKAVSRARLRV